MARARLAEGSFLLAGEFHYFRVPRQEWRSRLDLVAAAGCSAVSVYVPWNWHCPDPETLDVTGTTSPERDLHGALSEVRAAGLDCVLRPGPFITAEWRGGGIPSWLWETFPEILARRADGAVLGTEPYPAITYDASAYRDACAGWYAQVLSVIEPFCTPAGPVVNLQLDDEPSYWQRLLSANPADLDYSPVLVRPDDDGPSRYARWLLDRYGDLAAVNAAHGTVARTAGELEPPMHAPYERSGLPRALDWFDFTLSRIDDYVAFLYGLVVDSGVDVPVSVLFPYLLPLSATRFRSRPPGDRLPVSLTNEVYLSLFRPATCHEAKLAHVVSTHEAYHMWRGDDPPVTIEVQASNASYLNPGAMELLYAVSVARGIRGLCFYMMVGGRNPVGYELGTGSNYDISAPIAADGRTRPHYAVIRKLADVVRAVEPVLLTGAPDRDIWIGWWVPYEMTALAGAFGAFGDIAEQLRTTFSTGELGTAEVPTLQTLLTMASVSYGYLDLEHTDGVRLAEIPQLWVPAFEHLPATVQQLLAEYALAGGNLVLLPAVPGKDERDEPCATLTRLVWPDCDPPVYRPAQLLSEDVERVRTTADGLLVVPSPVAVLPTSAGAEVLAHVDGRPDQACALRRLVGRGAVTVLGFRFQYDPSGGGEHEAFLRRLLPRSQQVRADPAPMTAMRLTGDGGTLVCVANPVSVPVSGRVTVRATDGGDRTIPAVLDALTLSGPSARLLPLDLALTGSAPREGSPRNGAVLRSSTWELVERSATALVLAATPGELGEVVLESATLSELDGGTLVAAVRLPVESGEPPDGQTQVRALVLLATADRVRLDLLPGNRPKERTA
ncbi:MAG TPA: beta-galactosidase [Frankiaceae bacterium]|nr:beta-galactosidase [Frankiaceae bacterium]